MPVASLSLNPHWWHGAGGCYSLERGILLMCELKDMGEGRRWGMFG